jgi:hypothetical protein
MRWVPRFTRGIKFGRRKEGRRLSVRDQFLDAVSVDRRNEEIATLAHGCVGTFTAVEVALAILPLNDFSILCNTHALADGLVSLEFHNVRISSSGS